MRKPINLIGQKFNRLLISEMVYINKKLMYKCKCDCGNEIIADPYKIKTGHTKSCGCFMKEKASAQHFTDISGEKYNSLLVLERAQNRGKRTFWKCLCDCGTITEVEASNLKTGNTKTCGCNPYFKKGDLNPRYNPSLTDEERMIGRRYPEYNEWVKGVFKRDRFICKKCGNGGKYKNPLNAHHIESFASNPDKRTLLSNGITLCKKCHTNFHHNFGYWNNTEEQLKEFLSLKEMLGE